ncbi:MAG: Methyltransferase type 11 [Phycisphaerales bacterium]|nr:Methyltransferase type 11 [Phycisphaerales bacterium]
MPFLSHRRRQREWMDEPDADADALRQSLGFIRRINSLLGYTRATLKHLDHFSRSWKQGERINIVDLATGSADIPRAILRWADRKGFDVHIVGVDRHPVTVQAAEAGPADPRLRIVQGDVFNLPFPAGSFDYALTAMFLHHLDDAEVVTVLRTMGSLARRGVIIADLLRHYRAYAWVSLFTAFSSPMVRHDAKVSVGQAFSKNEILQISREAGLKSARYYRHFGHRFVLTATMDGT